MTLFLLFTPIADAKKVKFRHDPVDPGDTVAHTVSVDAEAELPTGALSQKRSKTVWFGIPQQDEPMTLDIEASVTSSNLPEPQAHPLNGRRFEFSVAVDGTTISPDASPEEAEFVMGAVHHLVALTDFGLSLDGVKLVVGEPVPDELLTEDMFHYFGLDGAEGEVALTLTGVGKVDGRKLAAFDVRVQGLGDPLPPEMTGVITVDPKTSRLHTAHLTQRMEGEDVPFPTTMHIRESVRYFGPGERPAFSATPVDQAPARNVITLADAARTDDLETVKRMLADGVGPDATDKYGIPALSAAGAGCNMDVMEVLLDAGADIEQKSSDGRTPLDYTADLCLEPGPTQLLLDRGASVPDPERAMRNAFPEPQQVLAAHLGLPIPDPPPVKEPGRPLTEQELEAVLPRIDVALAELQERGLLVVMGAGFSQSEAMATVKAKAEASPVANWGYVFTTRQDLDGVALYGQLFLGFGSIGDLARAVEAGAAIVKTFESHGFEVDWDGTTTVRPAIDLHPGQ